MLIDELIQCWVCPSCDFRQAANWNPADSAVLIRTGEQPEGSTGHWGSSSCSAANRENDPNNLWGQTTITTLIHLLRQSSQRTVHFKSKWINK